MLGNAVAVVPGSWGWRKVGWRRLAVYSEIGSKATV